MPYKKVNKKGLKSGIFYAIVGLTILTTALAGGVLAKYVKENKQVRNVVIAKDFYFTSNMLTEEGENYVLTPELGDKASIIITLGNNADQLRYSQDDINYEVSISNGESTDLISDKLEGGSVNTDELELSNMKKGETYTVTATGTAGYVKTLHATFTVAGDDNSIYKSITKNNNYVLLTVWTKNVKGPANITFPDGLIPDDTDLVMNNVKAYDGEFVDGVNFANAYSSHTYRFFIDNAADITVGSFIVRFGDAEAVPGTPE